MNFDTKIIHSNLGAVLFLMLATQSYANDSITVTNAWVADGPPGSTMYAGYLTIKNNYSNNIKLLTVTSSKFQNIEIHESQIVNHMAKMVRQNGLTIKANSTIQFAPGGLHLMMILPKDAIQLDNKINLVLQFQHNITVSVIAKVQKRLSK